MQCIRGLTALEASPITQEEAVMDDHSRDSDRTAPLSKDEIAQLTEHERRQYFDQCALVADLRVIAQFGRDQSVRLLAFDAQRRIAARSQLPLWIGFGAIPIVTGAVVLDQSLEPELTAAGITEVMRFAFGASTSVAAFILGLALTSTLGALRFRQAFNRSDQRKEYVDALYSQWRQLITERARSTPPTSSPPRSKRIPPPNVAASPTKAVPSGSGTAAKFSIDVSDPTRRRSQGQQAQPHNLNPNASYETFLTRSERESIARRFNWKCQLCLGHIPRLPFDYEAPHPRRLDIDHIVPRNHGGSDDISNLQPTHHQCNLRKGGRLITNAEFRRLGLHLDQPAERRQNVLSPADQRQGQSPPHTTSLRYRAESALNHAKLLRGMSEPLDSYRAQLSDEQTRRSEKFWAADHGSRLLKRCQRGHKFTEANTYYREDPVSGRVSRECRKCRERSRA